MKLRLAKIEDAKILFDWRNDKLTRLSSHNTNEISFENHIEWLENSLKSSSRKIYIAEINQIPVGTIRTDILNDKEVEVAYTVSPSSRGNGVATKMLNKLCGESKTVFYAEIKTDNIASLKATQKAGFAIFKSNENMLFLIKNIK